MCEGVARAPGSAALGNRSAGACAKAPGRRGATPKPRCGRARRQEDGWGPGRRAGAPRGKRCRSAPRDVDAGPHLAAWESHPDSGNAVVEKQEASLGAWWSLATAALPVATASPPPAVQEGRRVKFDLDANSVHEITPYSEIYGVHPRDFVFGRGFCMIPALHFMPIDVLAASNACAVKSDKEDTSSEDSDDDTFDDGEEWVLVRES